MTWFLSAPLAPSRAIGQKLVQCFLRQMKPILATLRLLEPGFHLIVRRGTCAKASQI